MSPRAALVAVMVCLGGCAGAGSGSDHATALPAVDPGQLTKLGAGHYADLPLGDEKLPSNAAGKAVRPKVSTGFSGVPTSNDWWSSLIWQFDRDGKPNPHSEPLYAHPLTLKAQSAGLGLGGAGKPDVGPRSYFFPYQEDLVIGVEGLEASATTVDDYDDWTVTARWDGGQPARALTATFGHGLPFVYAEATGGAGVVRLPAQGAHVFAESPGTVGVTVEGRAYGIFAPRGASWTRQGQTLRAELGGHGYFSVALLPDAGAETLARFRQHAFAFVTGSRVAWQYEPATSTLETTFTLS